VKYRKLDIEDDEDQKLGLEVKNGWIAALQHHFVGAIVPPTDEPTRLTLGATGREYLVAAAGSMKTVAPGAMETFEQTLFVGPKLQAQLEKAGPKLELVADYGKLTMLAKPLFIVLEWVHDALGNWGWSIVIVTFLLKLVFYPLSEASGKSMAKMKNLAPRIKTMQEQYKGDREKQGKAMMELYQREKVNPVAGCLPMIVQIPVFLAFYWVLRERGNAPGAVHALDQRPLLEGSLLHPAADHGRGDVHLLQAAADARRPGAGEGVHGDADRDVGDVRVLPGGPGALLGDEHDPADRAAVEHQSPHRAPGEEDLSAP
jgi:hypothetical protein